MEVIEDGNIMDRIPILLQRDFEYYEKNQTVLSETVCRGVVGGRLDFPRNASFAAVKIVLWLEDEFAIAFQHGSGMFTTVTDAGAAEGGVVKTSDPDKFVALAIKSSDALLGMPYNKLYWQPSTTFSHRGSEEHLHVLVQEALDHADLPVLTATLGAAALLKNTLYCYLQHVEDLGHSERLSILQACYKRYVTMSEAVAERVLDLHTRVLSLYILQDSGGRPLDDQTRTAHHAGTSSVAGWWLYMNGSRKDLWTTVPPRMAQRVFAGMLNETLTILTVRYCQTITTETTTAVLLNDILNILLCVAQLLPSICSSGADLAGLEEKQLTRDVRDVHAKCNELFKCLVYRGAELHFIHQAFKNQDEPEQAKSGPYPWFRFVSPKLFEGALDDVTPSPQQLPNKTAIGLELTVLLAQPQSSWTLLVKVLMMRNCHLSRCLLIHATRHMSADNSRWPADGLWFGCKRGKCGGFLCTADGYCRFQGDNEPGEEYARVSGALSFVLASIGSKAELMSTLCYALEVSGRDWAACLDKRQVWCDRRPPWLAALLALTGSALQFIPSLLVNAVQTGASMYQTMSLCLTCITRTLDCIPRSLRNAATVIENTLPSTVSPVGGSVLLQMLLTVLYEEILNWAQLEAVKEQAATSSISFDGTLSTPSSIALAIAEAVCSIDEDDKHTLEIQQFIAQSKKTFELSRKFGLEDFPQFAELFEEGDVSGSNAERPSDAAALTSQILMTSCGRDSLRVIYEHLQRHSERVFNELGVLECGDDVPLSKAPLLYIMFHIGRRPFDQYLRNEWPMPWSKLVALAKTWSGVEGAKVHVMRRADMRSVKLNKAATGANKQLIELHDMFKAHSNGLM